MFIILFVLLNTTLISAIVVPTGGWGNNATDYDNEYLVNQCPKINVTEMMSIEEFDRFRWNVVINSFYKGYFNDSRTAMVADTCWGP